MMYKRVLSIEKYASMQIRIKVCFFNVSGTHQEVRETSEYGIIP